MQSQERDLITGLFGRLQQFEAQPRDGEAEALIREQVTRQPGAPYLLVQTVLVQEQALKAAQDRIAELEAKASSAAPAAAGFLGTAPKLGPWGAPAAAAATAPPAAPRGSVPSTRSPLQAAVAPTQGGGFLRSAMATAAGVAGGALLFEGIRSLMGGNPFGGSTTAQSGGQGMVDGQQAMAGGETNPVPADLRDDGSAYAGNDGGNDDVDTAGYDDGGFDSSSDEDWA